MKTGMDEQVCGLGQVELGMQGLRSLNFRPQAGEGPAVFGLRLRTALEKGRLTPVLVFAFGPEAAQTDFLLWLGGLFPDCPLHCVGAGVCEAASLCGVQVYAVEAGTAQVERIIWEGRVVGTLVQGGGTSHLLIGGLRPGSREADEAAQTGQLFEILSKLLAENGFEMKDVIRTWFYNRDILAWYDRFNHVRNACYAPIPFALGALPASTAVSGEAPEGGALQIAAWVSKPVSGQPFPARELLSPLQCPAPGYGSAFSRAVALHSAEGTQVLVSGTASIEPKGATVWQGDPERQIALSLEVVSRILEQEGMDFSAVTRALVYFKKPEYLSIFQRRLGSILPVSFPYLAVHCDICRDDLLFEIELDAWRSANTRETGGDGGPV